MAIAHYNQYPNHDKQRDPIGQYLLKIGRVPMLTHAQELELGVLIRNWMVLEERRQLIESSQGKLTDTQFCELADIPLNFYLEEREKGLRARDKMVRSNLRLVVSIAKKYQNRGLELMDLIQEGSIGAQRAAEKFDPEKGYKFSTYAYRWIQQGITRAIADKRRNVRLPVHLMEKVNRIKKARSCFAAQEGRFPTQSELAGVLEISEDQLVHILQVSQSEFSLNAPVGRSDDRELIEVWFDEECELSPEDELFKSECIEECHALLEKLPERERTVLKLRHGIGIDRPMSLAEIALVLGVSRARMRQIHTKAMRKLRSLKVKNQVQRNLGICG
jgi:RNA polymerase sigma factor (sigma-70 family)